MNKIKSGFTLVEIMIVVAIIGILATIAVPSYQKYILRSYRVDARNLLQDVANRMSQQKMVSNSYIKDSTGNSFDINSILPENTDRYEFSFSVMPLETSNKFTIKAKAIGGQSKDDCKAFYLDQSGRQTADPQDKSKECWRH